MALKQDIDKKIDKVVPKKSYYEKFYTSLANEVKDSK